MESDSAEPVEKRRLLCIDGGGLRGAFPASILSEIERTLDRPLGEYFDLIAGTSTGGLLALGLGMGLPASDILALYENQGPKIFGQQHSAFVNATLRRIRWTRHWYRRKYSSEHLRASLEDPEVLGDSLIGDSRNRLVIPAWDPVRQGVYIYKTAHHERLRTDYKARAVDAALATASAPTIFQRHITEDDVGLLDGGVWANNPIAIAVVEAISLLGWSADQLQVLSLGCLDEIYTMPKSAGIGTLGSKVINLFGDGQSHGAMGMAKLLTGHEHERQAIYRINHTVSRNAYRLDDASVIQELKGLGHSYAREKLPSLRPIFFDSPVEPFNPVYKVTN